MTAAASMALASPIFSNWIDRRHARIAGAIAYLKTRGVLVSVVSREAQVRRYFVTGYARQKLAEDVIDIAIAKGWSDL